MIAWANVRVRWTGLVAAFLAVVAGVGLVGATLLVASSARPPVQPRLAATAALVTPPVADEVRTQYSDGVVPWSPAEAGAVVARIAAAPGVTAAVPDRAFYAQPFPGGRPAGDPEDTAGGHGWASLPLGGYRLVDGVAPRGPGEVAVDRSLGVPPGSTLPLNLATGLRDVLVTGVVDGPGVWFPDAEAAALAPGVRTIGVLATGPVALPPGVDGTLLTGDDRGRVEPAQRAHERFLGTQVLVALALLTVVTTVIVVSATLSLAVGARRRELGLLRTLGATPGRVRRTVLAEAALVGTAGGATGALVAVALAPPLHGYLVAMRAAAAEQPVRVTPGPLVLAAALGVVVAVAGAWVAARRAARARPLDAVEDRADIRPVSRARLLCAAGVLACGAALVVAAAAADGDGRLGFALGAGAVLVVAASLAAPLLAGPAGALLTRPSGRGAATLLVRAGLRSAPGRAGAVAAPVIVAVGFAALLSGMADTMAVAYPAEQTARLAGQSAVEGAGTPGLADDVTGALRVPGSRIPLPTTVVLPGPSGTVALDAVGTADPGLVRPGEVVLSEPVAASLRLTAGDTAPFRFPDGVLEPLRVTRVLPVDPPRGDVAIDRDTARAHDPSALADTAFVPAGRVPEVVRVDVRVYDARAYALADYAADARLSNGLVALLVLVSAGYGGLAVANGIAAGVRARRPELAALAAAGATRGQRGAVSAAEAAVAATLGSVLGLLVTAGPLTAMASGLSRATGTAVAPQLDPAVVAGSAGCCVAVAAGVACIVGRGRVRRLP